MQALKPKPFQTFVSAQHLPPTPPTTGYPAAKALQRFATKSHRGFDSSNSTIQPPSSLVRVRTRRPQPRPMDYPKYAPGQHNPNTSQNAPNRQMGTTYNVEGKITIKFQFPSKKQQGFGDLSKPSSNTTDAGPSGSLLGPPPGLSQVNVASQS